MVALAARLLLGLAYATVEHAAPKEGSSEDRLLKRPEVGELGPVVRHDQAEEPLERLPAQSALERVEGARDGPRVLSGSRNASCTREDRWYRVSEHWTSRTLPIAQSISQAAARSSSGSARNAACERPGPCGVGLAGEAALLGL